MPSPEEDAMFFEAGVKTHLREMLAVLSMSTVTQNPEDADAQFTASHEAMVSRQFLEMILDPEVSKQMHTVAITRLKGLQAQIDGIEGGSDG